MNPKKKKDSFSSLFVLVGVIVVLLDFFLQSHFRKINFGLANSGISFGFAQNLNFWVLVLPAIIFLSFIFSLVWKGKGVNVFLIALAFGALGNVLPRLIFGDVWDYIIFKTVGLWVNLSDLLITFSVLSYILSPDGSTNTI